VIVVDTNVISELMRGEPHPTMLAWAAAQPHALLYTTHIIPKLRTGTVRLSSHCR
jgi:toxin FitB